MIKMIKCHQLEMSTTHVIRVNLLNTLQLKKFSNFRTVKSMKQILLVLHRWLILQSKTCQIWCVALTVSDVCLKLGCFQSTSTYGGTTAAAPPPFKAWQTCPLWELSPS